jgi:hypothetical protein
MILRPLLAQWGQGHAGLPNHADNLRAFENIFKTNEPVRRDRAAADQGVFALGTFGAFHSGSPASA